MVRNGSSGSNNNRSYDEFERNLIRYSESLLTLSSPSSWNGLTEIEIATNKKIKEEWTFFVSFF